MDNKNESLRYELVKLSKYASKFSVNHTEVAKKAGISYDYARQIRKGNNGTTERSNEIIQSLIDAYRKAVSEKQRELKKIIF